jgi:zinc transporter ZupT
MTGWAQVGDWALLAGSALVVGAAVGFLVRIPQRLVASVMAFGAGVLLSAISFELIAEAPADEADRQGEPAELPGRIDRLLHGRLIRHEPASSS